MSNKIIKKFYQYTGTQTLLLIVIGYCVMVAPIAAQTKDDEEHRSHHPDIYGTQAEQTSLESSVDQAASVVVDPVGSMGEGPSVGGMMNGMMGAGGMDKMMEKMGAPKPKDLYPSLMALPDLPQEKRDDLKNMAHERMSQATSIMKEGFKELSNAVDRNDFATMQDSVEQIKEGLNQYDSGLATERALAEGKAPKTVALQWFKSQMNLLPVSMQTQSTTFFGMTPFHTMLMFVLILFMAIIIWMYFFKLRRASTLLAELASSQIEASCHSSPESISKLDEVNVSQAIPENAISSSVPQTSTASVVDKWSGELQVINQFMETPTVKTLRLAIPNGGPLPFTYQPGQFLTFILQPEGKVVKRSYTIASSPTQRDYIEVTVKREEQGLISRFLHDHIKIGDHLSLQGPAGKFSFNGSEAKNIVLISGGVGITPMMSVTRYLTDHCWQGNIYFLFCARTSNDFIFRQELEYLQQRHANLHVLASMTRAEGTSWMGPQGQFTPDVIKEFVPNIDQHRAHICGPPAMMDAIKDMLLGLGVPQSQIKTEAFGTIKRIPSEHNTVVPQAVGQSVPKVKFSISEKTADLQPNKTILEAAEECGIDIDNSCRSGTCGSCRVKLLSGQVSMDVEDGLELDDKANGYILACQAVAKEDVIVEA
jgi:ferredoxin-NADP reductase